MSDFNRGLEQGIELGKLKERERIIKFLEYAWTKPINYHKIIEHIMSGDEKYSPFKGENK